MKAFNPAIAHCVSFRGAGGAQQALVYALASAKTLVPAEFVVLDQLAYYAQKVTTNPY